MQSFTTSAAIGCLVFGGLIGSVRADEPVCQVEVSMSDLVSKQGSDYFFEDGRKMTGTIYDIGGCGTKAGSPTGTQHSIHWRQQTIISYDEPSSGLECLVKNIGGNHTYDSYQAMVLVPQGFQIMPRFEVRGIDAQTFTHANGSMSRWRESVVVFGVSRGAVVFPTAYSETSPALIAKTYHIQHLAQIGLGALGNISVAGMESSAAFVFAPVCDGVDFDCTMNYEFEQPVETVVILSAAAETTPARQSSGVFVGKPIFPCTCMCSERVTSGTHYAPAAAVGFCNQVSGDVRSRPACDILATANVCTYQYRMTYSRAGGVQPDGTYPCEANLGPSITSVEPYSP